MKAFMVFFIGGILASSLMAQTPPLTFKSVPTRPPLEASVVVENQEILPECEESKICVEGYLKNIGLKTANGVRLRIELGGGTHTKPRTFLNVAVENKTMNPGDVQEFAFSLYRRISYKDPNDSTLEKSIEVGRYNFKVVPVWGTISLKNEPQKKATKASKTTIPRLPRGSTSR